MIKQKSAHVLPTLSMQTAEGALKESVHPPLPQESQLIDVCTQNPHTPILAFLEAAPCQHAASGSLPPHLLFASLCLPLTGTELVAVFVFFVQPHDSNKALKIPSFGSAQTLSGLAQPNLDLVAEL